MPVVLFGVRSAHVAALETAAVQSGCGFAIDPDRLELLTIEAVDVRAMNLFGKELLAAAEV